MKTLEQIFDIIEKHKISISEYKENGNLCGYELSTYTDGGVNEIIFLDFREEHQDPKNASDFIEEFESWLNCETIDEKIDIYRQDKSYRDAFTIKQSLKDFKNFDKNLRKLLKKLKN